MDDFADQLREQWAGDPPHVVHSHFWMSGLAALAAARDLGIPVVHTFHALGVVKRRHQGSKDTSPPNRIELERRIAKSVDRVIATCSDEVFELVRQDADRRRVSVVPCGVDVERFTPDGPAEPRRPDRHRLVAASRLVERKGIGDVVAALAEVPDAELHVAGGPERRSLEADPEAARLRRIAVEYGVEDRLVLRGRVGRDEMPALLRSADAVVCAPWYEPFGIVPLEAMACGAPVVATAVGGQIDSVVDGVTGVHVPPRDPEALAATLSSLLDHPELRERLGAAGVRRARERFAHARVGAATREVYAAVVMSGAAGAARHVREVGA
jgi:D-inositol-3-phosphate glycosyltransferase